jgi:hypothetical protein
MKQPFVIAVIHKDAVEHLPVTVPIHEVAVLAAVHGQHKITLDENADLPDGLTEFEFDPEEEFARLELRYGSHRENGMSFAAMAFGGLTGFLDAMEAAEATGDAPKRLTKAEKAAATRSANKAEKAAA